MDYTKLLERIDVPCKKCSNVLVSFYNLGREIKVNEQCYKCGYINDFSYENDINYYDYDSVFMQRLSDILDLNQYTLDGEIITKVDHDCAYEYGYIPEDSEADFFQSDEYLSLFKY